MEEEGLPSSSHGVVLLDVEVCLSRTSHCSMRPSWVGALEFQLLRNWDDDDEEEDEKKE